MIDKGLPKNKLAISGSEFQSDFADLIEKAARLTGLRKRILRLKIGKRWPEDERSKGEVVFGRALR